MPSAEAPVWAVVCDAVGLEELGCRAGQGARAEFQRPGALGSHVLSRVCFVHTFFPKCWRVEADLRRVFVWLACETLPALNSSPARILL